MQTYNFVGLYNARYIFKPHYLKLYKSTYISYIKTVNFTLNMHKMEFLNHD